jgi:predicted AAA+ superfamily ATPase
MIERFLQPRLLDLAGRYPILTLTGPQQSGKTTLSRMAFPDLPYVSILGTECTLRALNCTNRA